MADPWLRRLAAHGIGAAATIGPPPRPLAGLLGDLAEHRLVGVLAEAIGDGALELVDSERDAVARAHETAMREALLLEEVLLEAVDVLDRAGVDHRVLKGAALAHNLHPDPAQRTFGDNDLLVPAEGIDTAIDALVAAGAERPVPRISPDFDRRFAKSVTLRWRADTELDLHRTLVAGPYGFLVDLADLVRRPVDLVLAGRTLCTLPLHLHLLHGAMHVALGDVAPRLGNVRDLALATRHDAVDVELVVATAERWRCTVPVARGLQSVSALGLEPSPLEVWAAGREPGAIERWRLSAYASRTGRYRRQALASLPVMPWGDRVAFSRALLRRRRPS